MIIKLPIFITDSETTAIQLAMVNLVFIHVTGTFLDVQMLDIEMQVDCVMPATCTLGRRQFEQVTGGRAWSCGLRDAVTLCVDIHVSDCDAGSDKPYQRIGTFDPTDSLPVSTA